MQPEFQFVADDGEMKYQDEHLRDLLHWNFRSEKKGRAFVTRIAKHHGITDWHECTTLAQLKTLVSEVRHELFTQ